MNRTFRGLMLAVMLGGAVPAMMPALAAEPAARQQPGKYSVSTTLVGTMLDDPAAHAVLQRYIPDVINNANIAMARGQTLAAVQPYFRQQLTDARLSAIDADLAKLPPIKK